MQNVPGRLPHAFTTLTASWPPSLEHVPGPQIIGDEDGRLRAAAASAANPAGRRGDASASHGRRVEYQDSGGAACGATHANTPFTHPRRLYPAAHRTSVSRSNICETMILRETFRAEYNAV